jgi:hypothetical protein
MDYDLRAVMGALGGAALYGFVQFGALVKSGHAPSLRDYGDLLINVACAVMCGVLLTIFLAKVVAPFIPIAGLRDTQLVGLVFGSFGWELLPVLYKAGINKATKQAAKIGAGE